jgi:SAM-dependent methyltransferase
MNRNKKILNSINKNGCGLEIGPSHRPIAAKRDGFNVHILDHLTKEKLIEIYQTHGVDLEAIEEVDFVWNGESFSELTKVTKYYDWIIASHVIEHTPDLIGFLKDCDAILKDDGVISLVVPDKRYCFDRFRPLTGLSRIIDSHYHQASLHSAGTVAEYYLNVVSKNGSIAWDVNVVGEYGFIHSLEDARRGIDRVIENEEYIDVHSWCFTPHSFRLIINDLYNLGIISFKEVFFSSTVGCEFYITLGRMGKSLDLSRLEALRVVESELQDIEPRIESVKPKSESKVAKILKGLTNGWA